jgi:hypothetical protein
MNRLVSDTDPEGPSDKLCPSGEPNEAMADRVPDGRMVPTRAWRPRPLSHRCVLREPRSLVPKPNNP